MLLSEDHLGDAVPVLKIEWTVNDVDRLQEAILSDPRHRPMPMIRQQYDIEDSPPPKGAYMIFDRPRIESPEGLTAQSMPIFIGQLLLLGARPIAKRVCNLWA